LLAGALLAGACGVTAGAPASATSQTAVVQRGTVEATISATGSVAALADVNLDLASGGTITEVLVKVGDRVTPGQPLIRADTRDLTLQLQQAEANLAGARAKYEQTKTGATAKDIEQAQAAVTAAQAKYRQTVAGTTTPEDIANAEAAVRAAEAKLAATQAGTTTPGDVAAAEAQLRSAQAKLAQVQAGADPNDIASARQKLDEARQNRAKQASDLSNAKEQARLAMEQAANDLRSAQAQYGAAKLVYDAAARTGKDPNVACVSKQTCNNKLTDIKLRQYKSDFEAAQLAMANAEQALQQKEPAYEDARQQEIVGLQTADSQIQDAQAQLDKLTAPPDPQAVVQAQAAVDQAQANLDKLRLPAKDTDLAQARAAVDQARATLAKLRRPADPNDVTQARANVASVQAALDDLQAGPKATDLATALAAVQQAEAARDLARSQLDQATLVAPFAGVVAAVNAMPGQRASAGSAAGLVTLVDDSTLSINLNVAESDIARVALGQPARATFDALPNRTVAGTVTAIAPKATVQSNVVSYLVTVALDRAAEASVKTGMTANVAVVVARKADVLTIPNRAVQGQGQQKVVTVQYRGEQFSVPVQIGLVGDTVSEVVAGLKAGDVVVSGGSPVVNQADQVQPRGLGGRTGGFGFPGGGRGR
jgi:HlyD family secretion protein